MSALFNIEPYLPILASGHTIVTANARQSAKMRSAFCQQRKPDHQVIYAPKLYSINTWLERMWQHYQLMVQPQSAVVLNSLQRHALWQKIIDADLDALPLVKTEQLYPQADSAFRNLILWQLDAKQWPEADPIHGLCQKWFTKFEKQLSDNRWLVPEQKQLLILQALQADQIPPTEQLHLLGFDDVAPLTRLLLEMSTQRLIEHQAQSEHEHKISRQQWPNKISEITAAATWAKVKLEQNPNATIGIIAPNLGQVRDDIEQIFSESFELQTYDLTLPRYTLPFNFSAGTPLASAAIVHDALSLLKLITGRVSFDTACALLTSPFWLAADHPRQIGAALNQIYKSPKAHISSAQLRRLFSSDDTAPVLKALLEVHQQYRQNSKNQSIHHWMDYILSTLKQLGWPGQRRLDSVEYQQVNQFQKLLEEFTSLGLVSAEVSLPQVLSLLEKQAQTTPFQAQTPDSPIQILGALEGAALDFDFCWVLNCDNQTWPPPPAPNPLVPVNMQRANGMPNASASKQLQYAQSLTQRLKQCAPEVVFSSSESDGESELSPSGLIADLELSNNNAPAPKSLWAQTVEQWFEQRQQQWRDCESAPAINPNSQQPGGVSVIQWQAAQPFNAFCRFRLNLRPLATLEHHLPANLRGQITHLALALFWQNVKTQAALLTLDTDAQQKLVSQCISQAINEIPATHEYLTPEHKTLEHQRQANIINRWLEVEKERPPFTVQHIEQTHTANILELEFKLQFDRIDEIDDQCIIIDYKSGNTSSSKQWQPKRLVAPQLPLYACYWPETTQAVSFGVINGKQQKFDGVGDLHSPIEGVQNAEKAAKLPWPELKDAWRDDIQTTVTEFKQGVTLNHVYDKATVDYQTDYLAINRLAEMSDNFHIWSEEANRDA